MDNNVQTEQHDMNFREILEVILKGKFLIAIFAVIAIVISMVYNSFMIDISYEAKTTIQVTPFNLKTNSLSNEDIKIIDNLTTLPSMSTDLFMRQVLSTDVLNETINKLDLRSEQGDLISSGNLASSISISNPTNTNLIEIICSGSDPKLCAQITDTLAESYIKFMTTNIRQQIQQSVDLITAQLTAEEQNLTIQSNSVTVFIENNVSSDELIAEIKELINQIVRFKADLNVAEKDITTDSDALEILLAAIKGNPDINPADFNYILSPSELDNNESQLQVNLATDNLSAALMKIEINKLQNRLVRNTSLKFALTNQIELMSERLIEAQSLLTEVEYKYKSLLQNLDMSKKAYSAYQRIYNEARLALSANIGESSIIVLSHATVPSAPVPTNRVMNIIVATFFGLLFGIFIVLFRNYWNRSKRN